MYWTQVIIHYVQDSVAYRVLAECGITETAYVATWIDMFADDNEALTVAIGSKRVHDVQVRAEFTHKDVLYSKDHEKTVYERLLGAAQEYQQRLAVVLAG